MYRSILVPVDLNEASSWAKAIPAAVSLCQCFKASLTLCTVVPDGRLMLDAQWSPIGFDELLEKVRARLNSLGDTIQGAGPIRRHVETGSIYAGILDIASRIGADLIVLAAHRPAMKDYLLGTNAARVVRHARCSVLVVRD